ncbi:MAG: hypothetical protein CL608_26430 [Anaerolineaceae bacterium]|nr:hypothetical protein [Anaerolineaceae bacterium]
MSDQLHQRRQVIADRRRQWQIGDDLTQAVQLNVRQVCGFFFPDQGEQRSQWLLELVEIVGKVKIQLVALRDEVNVFQPSGQVFAVFDPNLVFYWETVPVNGREEIGNGRTKVVFVERSDVGLPGGVIGKEFGITPAQRQINLQAVYLQRGHGRFGVAIITVLQTVNQAGHLKKTRFILPERVSGFPDVGQQLGNHNGRPLLAQSDRYIGEWLVE